MKTKAKPLLALLLALTMLFAAAPLTAFAADAGDTVVWSFGDDVDSYAVLGEAVVGTQTVDKPYSGYLFTAPEAGLYQLTVTQNGSTDVGEMTWYGVTNDLADGKASTVKPLDVLCATPDAEEWESFYSFAAGETQLIGFDDLPDGKPLQVTITFVDAVVSLTPYEPADTYVIDASIWQYEDSSSSVDVDLAFAVTLAKGKTCYTYPVVTGTLQPGDVTLQAEFGGITSEFTLHCVAVSDVISAVAFPEDYDPTVAEYYNGDAYLKNDFPTELVVTFPDGSKKSFDVEIGEWFFGYFYYADVVTPDGVSFSIYIDAYYDDDSGDYLLEAYVGETTLAKVTCPVEIANRRENLKYFFSCMSYAFTETMSGLPYNIAYGYGLAGIFEDLGYMFSYMREECAQILAYLF